MTLTWRALVATVLAAAGVLVALTLRHAANPDRTQTVSAPRIAGPLAKPNGKAVLRIAGVAEGNVARDRTELDFATLDTLATQSLTTYEPFLKRDITFTGVSLGQVLEAAGVRSTSRTIFMHALDDYHVELPLAGLAKDALLATRAGGRPIALKDGGPIRVVFPRKSAIGAVTDNWIWSLDSITAH